MTPTHESLLLAIGMMVVSILPVYITEIRKYTSVFFLLGTGALTGVCLFDLIPDVAEIGGTNGLLLAAFVAIIYSSLHLYHNHKHKRTAGCCAPHKLGKAFYVFLISIISHCFASGMLLGLSNQFSVQMGENVFWSLALHKAYEAISYSSIVITQNISKKKSALLILLYCSSLPLGVYSTIWFESLINQNIAIAISSLAVGSLISCLYFDFMQPCFEMIRKKKRALIWLALGFILARFLIPA